MAETIELSYAELLGKVGPFDGVNRVTLAQMAAYLETIGLGQGECLFQEGDEGDALLHRGPRVASKSSSRRRAAGWGDSARTICPDPVPELLADALRWP